MHLAPENVPYMLPYIFKARIQPPTPPKKLYLLECLFYIYFCVYWDIFFLILVSKVAPDLPSKHTPPPARIIFSPIFICADILASGCCFSVLFSFFWLFPSHRRTVARRPPTVRRWWRNDVGARRPLPHAAAQRSCAGERSVGRRRLTVISLVKAGRRICLPSSLWVVHF